MHGATWKVKWSHIKCLMEVELIIKPEDFISTPLIKSTKQMLVLVMYFSYLF